MTAVLAPAGLQLPGRDLDLGELADLVRTIAEFLGLAATHAVRVRNPQALLAPTPAYDLAWVVAS